MSTTNNTFWKPVMTERAFNKNHIGLVVELSSHEWVWEILHNRSMTLKYGHAPTKHMAQVAANRAAFKLGLCKTGSGLSR